jgi:hypothetical protein
MAYVPVNLQMFCAAYAGALAGMGASDRVPTDNLPADYAGLASVAGAFAQSFDTEWALSPTTSLDLQCAQELCEVAWQDRAPQAVPPNLTPANWTSLTQALIAMIKAGDAYFAGLGIVPPPVGGGCDNHTITEAGSGTLDDVSTVGTGCAGAVRFTAPATVTVTGFANGVDGKRITVWSVDSDAHVILKNLDAGSAAANQIVTPSGADYDMAYQDSVELYYDGIALNWRVQDKVL